ncbi:MAG TPA: SRPBCC family protein [Chitinophagaceae bacterium]|nr:SRPBCC family protein [Chitinophagaceae bacterium]
MAYLQNPGENTPVPEHPAASMGNTINVTNPERIISVAVGSYLLGAAFKSRPITLRSLRRGITGTFLLYRGLSGHCPIYQYMGNQGEQSRAINIRESLTVNRPVSEVYAFWRKLENLPLFMKHLTSVKELDNGFSSWQAEIPGKIGNLSWQAEMVKEEPNRILSWKSVPHSPIEHAGKIVFSEALGGKGTTLDILITYRAPAGELGRGISRLLNPVFKKMIHAELLGFKDFMDTRKGPVRTGERS